MYTRLADRPLNLSEYWVDWVVFDHSVASDSCKPIHSVTFVVVASKASRLEHCSFVCNRPT